MKKIWLVLAIADLAVVNIGLGFLIYKTLAVQAPLSASPNPAAEQRVIQQDVCGPDCRGYIDEKVASLAATLSTTLVSQPTTKPVVVTRSLPKALTRTVSYVTIPGSGSTALNDWQDVPGTDFYFDTTDYPGLKEIYFEANMKLFNGNGMAFIRLFDVTHGIGVQGSEISTNSQNNPLITSGLVSFWTGKNLIRIQAKSLTADTTIFNYGRLKVITEN
jgi:hypothetical protein